MQRKRGNGAIQYIRVSTRKQTDSPLNLDNQAAQSEEFIRESGWQFDKAFIDPGESGTTMERPKFLEMVAYAKANPHVGHIVVSQLDRFARNQRDYHNLVADLWRME